MSSLENSAFKLSSLSLFYPCHNEEKNVESAIVSALEILPKVAHKYEVIIVNDGSHDKTKELAEDLAAIHNEVVIINHPTNKGYGAALKTGFTSAQHEWVFFSDGDMQFDLNQLVEFIPYANSHQAIIGYRTRRAEGKGRALNARLFKLFVDLLFRLHVKDIDCAFKLFRNDTLKKITLESDGAFINAELLYKLKKNGCEFKQLPVNHFPRKHGKPTGSNLAVITKAGMEMLKLYLHLKFGLFSPTRASNVKN